MAWGGRRQSPGRAPGRRRSSCEGIAYWKLLAGVRLGEICCGLVRLTLVGGVRSVQGIVGEVASVGEFGGVGEIESVGEVEGVGEVGSIGEAEKSRMEMVAWRGYGRAYIYRLLKW